MWLGRRDWCANLPYWVTVWGELPFLLKDTKPLIWFNALCGVCASFARVDGRFSQWRRILGFAELGVDVQLFAVHANIHSAEEPTSYHAHRHEYRTEQLKIRTDMPSYSQ